MRYASLGLVALMGLSGTATAMGMGAIQRELRFAAELGISPDAMLKQQKSVHTLVDVGDLGNVITKTVSVSGSDLVNYVQ